MHVKTLAAAALLLAATLFLFTGCNSGGTSGGSQAPPPAAQGTEVSLAPVMTAYLAQTVATGALSQALVGDTTLVGTMTVTDANGVAVEGSPFDWSISLDPANPLGSVASNRTLVLFPGTYNFALLIQDNQQQYVGTATKAIGEGENTVSMNIHPVIGDTLTDVSVVWELPELRFDYPEIGSIVDPELGVFIDENTNNQMQFYQVGIDPDTGTFYPLETNFQVPGSIHRIRLELYSQGNLVGRSVVEQETILAGVDLAMDLVSIHGEVQFSFNEQTSEATFTFSIPYVVAHEAGGVGDLLVLYNIAGPGNPFNDGSLTLVDNGEGNPVTASLTFTDYQFGDVFINLAFNDATDGDLLGTCNVGPVTLVTVPGTSALCELTLRRRQVVGGSLLAVVGVNVVDENAVPVPGATVSLNGNFAGITGSGFGTPGYVKLLTVAGQYLVSAEKDGVVGENTVIAIPLGVHNVQVVLGGTVSLNDTDGDGVADAFDQCPGTPAGTVVDDTGCPPPVPEPNPNAESDYNMTATETGDIGRAGGATWSFRDIDFQAAGKTLLASVFNDDPDPQFAPYGISMDDTPIVGAEIMHVDAAQSDLPNGVVVFTGTTRIWHAINQVWVGVATRITATVTDSTDNPLFIADTSQIPFPLRLGEVGFQVPAAGYDIHIIGEVSTNGGASWAPYLDFFDAFNNTPVHSARISFGASWYDM